MFNTMKSKIYGHNVRVGKGRKVGRRKGRRNIAVKKNMIIHMNPIACVFTALLSPPKEVGSRVIIAMLSFIINTILRH